MNITALPWEVLPPFPPSYSDHGYRRVVEVRRGGVGDETLVIYAKAANMLIEGEGFVFGKDDAKFIALACNAHNELVAALKSQHHAIDWLMAQLITIDRSFLPSKSEVWPLIEASAAALDKAEAA